MGYLARLWPKTQDTDEAAVRAIRATILFDARWYKEVHEDLRRTALDPAIHYLRHGGQEKRNPHPLFDADWYLSHAQGLGARDINPLLHYLSTPAPQRISPHPLFDVEWYLGQLPAGKRDKVEPLTHYLELGWRSHLSPHPLFDPAWYGACALNGAPMNPLLHYVLARSGQMRSTHPLFDPEFYLTQSPDIGSGAPPLVDYLRQGWRNGYRPARSFELHKLAAPISIDPLTHFVKSSAIKADTPDPVPDMRPNSGFASSHAWRSAIRDSGLFDAAWYLKTYRDVALSKMAALDHFVRFGSAEKRSPGPAFNAAWYAEEYADVAASGLEPLAHYLLFGKAKGFAPTGSIYRRWTARFDTITPADRAAIEADIDAKSLPSLKLLVFIDPRTEKFLTRTLAALQAQIYGRFQALIVIGTECSSNVCAQAQDAARAEPRFAVVVQAALTSRIMRAREGEHIVIVGGGVLLRPHALYMMARAAAQLDGAALIYADEDRIGEDGHPEYPFFKPSYSPVLAEEIDYLGRAVMLDGKHSAMLDLVARMRIATARGDIPTLVTRAIAARGTADGVPYGPIAHIPAILFHDLAPADPRPPQPVEAARDALPGVSIILPTRDRVDLLRACLASIEASTDYPRDRREIIVIDNGSQDEECLDFLDDLVASGKARVLKDRGPFNFARLNNAAASLASYEILLFLNNDTTVIDPCWLRRLACFAIQADVGAVGAKLLYPDRTIQHGGVVLGIQGVAAHDQVGLPEEAPGARIEATREVAAVTGACLAMRHDLFDALGGFDTAAAVAFNDTLLCVRALEAGYRNIIVKEPLLIHFESRTRGYDDDPARLAAFRREAAYARRRHRELFRDDPYYSPNLCLQTINALAFPPRRSKPWRIARRDPQKLKILFLSATHEMGHGVPVVIDMQARYLASLGHDIVIGGPKGEREMSYEGCRRVHLSTPGEAAAFAVEAGMDCVIAETPPFFSIMRWLGDWPRTLLLDHGEPPPDLFPDAAARQAVLAEKRLCFAMASQVFVISESVKNQGLEETARIIPNGNSHLLIWDESLRARRDDIRRRHGWQDKLVVLNVCRFHAAERRYKGLDTYMELFHEFRFARPRLAAQTVFLLCGKACADDVEAMQKIGFDVHANVTDAELAELYLAADIYANFSRWEGYNLGIGQALAAGLPVLASDIAAHRAFSIFTSNEILKLIEKLADLATTEITSRFARKRQPVVADWSQSLQVLEREIVSLCRDAGNADAPAFARV